MCAYGVRMCVRRPPPWPGVGDGKRGYYAQVCGSVSKCVCKCAHMCAHVCAGATVVARWGLQENLKAVRGVGGD